MIYVFIPVSNKAKGYYKEPRLYFTPLCEFLSPDYV